MIVALLVSFACSHPLGQGPGGDWKAQVRADGVEEADRFGTDVASLRDINGDAVPDAIVGAIGANVAGAETGKAFAISGSDGTVIFELIGQPFQVGGVANDFGISVDAGDVDGDSFDDMLIGAPNETPGVGPREGSAYLFSGKDGSLLRRFDGIEPLEDFGQKVGVLGDLNQDGHEDFYIQSLRRDTFGPDFGSALVYSGKTLTVMFEMGGLWGGTGQDGDGMGDVNGDGYHDFVMTDGNQGGSAAIYSGMDGSELLRVFRVNPSDGFGRSVASLGDLDGDGISEFAVGAPETFFDTGGHVYVYSGATGTLFQSFETIDPYRAFGADLDGPGDVDGDGYGDLLITASLTGTEGAVAVFSGFDGRRLSTFDGGSDPLVRCFGDAVHGANDINQDGLMDILIGAPCSDFNGAIATGSMFVYTLDSYLESDAKEISAANGGIVSFDLDFPDAEAGRTYQLLASTARPGRSGPQNVIPLSMSPVLRKTFGTALPIFSTPAGNLDANGDATVLMTLTPGEASAAVGRTFRFSAITYQNPTTLSLASATVNIEVLP